MKMKRETSQSDRQTDNWAVLSSLLLTRFSHKTSIKIFIKFSNQSEELSGGGGVFILRKEKPASLSLVRERSIKNS